MKPMIYHETLPGKSNAHLLTLEDGKRYVVKYLQTGFEKSLANEWIGYCIGRYLGVPIPFAKIISLDEEMKMNLPNPLPLLPSRYQFASSFIPDCKNLHEITDIEKITNQDTLAMLILFDYWLLNSDRTRKNILLQKKSPGEFQVWSIDHAEILTSYRWSLDNLTHASQGLFKSATHQILCRYIENENAFLEALEIIQTMPILLIEEIVDLIPDDWLVTKEEKKAIVAFLIHRRKKVLPKLLITWLKKVYRPQRIKLSD